MSSVTKTITIFGTKEVGKSTLFRQLIRLFSDVKNGKIISPVINYTESLIKIDDNTYKLIDTPTFVLSSKSEIEKEISHQIEEVLKASDLIC